VTRGPEIEHVRKEGKRVRTSSLEVRATASLRAFPRIGVVVPKYGHNSVERNLVKRRLREIIRLDVLPSLVTIDVVVRALPRAYDRAYDDLRSDLRRVARQLGAQFPGAGTGRDIMGAGHAGNAAEPTEPQTPNAP
jgi:ribonuclease P protein component